MVRWTEDGILYEADPRHVEKLLRDLGMENCKPLSTPGVKPPQTPPPSLRTEEEEKAGVLLEPALQTLYRGGAARCNYLTSDRQDVSFATKELCRSMSAPTEVDMVALKHLCRFLKGRPRLVQRIPRTAPRRGEDGAGLRG